MACDCPYPRSYVAQNRSLGMGVKIHICCMAKALEDMGVKGIIEHFNHPDPRTWDEYQDEQGKMAQEECERWDLVAAAEGEQATTKLLGPKPGPFTRKEPPDWLKRRVDKKTWKRSKKN